MRDPLAPEPTLETIRTVHASFRFAADDLERMGAPGDRVERRTVVAWLRSPAVAAGFLLDELMTELTAGESDA